MPRPKPYLLCQGWCECRAGARCGLAHAYLSCSEDRGHQRLHGGAVHCIIGHALVQDIIKGECMMLHILRQVHLDARLVHSQPCLRHHRFNGVLLPSVLLLQQAFSLMQLLQ